MIVRPARRTDFEAIVRLRALLWPAMPDAENRAEVRAILDGAPHSTLPLVQFVAEDNRTVVGFVEVGLRSYADGCDPTRPCGYVEGWYVTADYRRRGAGRRLIEHAEAWARAQGCTELASDTWLDNDASQQAHVALGFDVVDRCVNFRKPLAPAPDPTAVDAYYGTELARVHHEHFGMVARAASRELLARLARAGVRSGTVVDLAAGSGILSRAMLEAGFAVHGVDLSENMLRLARAEAPAATFVHGSLWNAGIPVCVAVTAIGEAFSYAADPTASRDALAARLAAIHAALVPGGLLLFDVAGPGRSGPSGMRRAFWSHADVHLGIEEHETAGTLSRAITLFVPEGGRYRRVQEMHTLRLYTPEDIEQLLSATGFIWERLRAYDDFEPPPGWHAFAATKGGRADAATR